MRSRLTLVLLFALWFPHPADACSCAPARPCETFWSADLVFVGHVERVARKPQGNEVAQFVVEEWLRGEKVGRAVAISSYGVGGSCDYGFEDRTKYLVHAWKRPDGTWGAGLCGGTIPIAEGGAALAYIREALARPGPGSLSGNAFTDIDPTKTGVRSGPPLTDARLFLRGSAIERMTRPDKDGNYRFADVPAGDYSLIVDLPAGYVAIPPKRVAIGKDSCVRHSFHTERR